jgi:hypothetical protein
MKSGRASLDPGRIGTSRSRNNTRGADQVSRKVGGVSGASGSVIDSGFTNKSVKGGGDRWVIMATAMTNALERMRLMWELLDRLQELHTSQDCICAQHLGNWTPLKNEVTAVANILKSGLKARDYEERS